jgi:hypothetical protein
VEVKVSEATNVAPANGGAQPAAAPAAEKAQGEGK